MMGGGPAGYEAALVAAQHGANVTVVERDGLGGACVLYDCVPSKTFIASAGAWAAFRNADELGIRTGRLDARVDLPEVHGRVKGLALAQSADVRARVVREGVRIRTGWAQFRDDTPGLAQHRVGVTDDDGRLLEVLDADVVLIATGAHPRVLSGAEPDGERVLNWRQLYDLPDLPEHLVVIGSGVTGAEFASAYTEMGVQVTLVSRTSVSGIYAAGDCTGLLMLASVAQMQGRTAMWHALGEGVTPIKLKTVAANVFTHPEIANVGISQQSIDSGEVPARTVMLPLATNARAKMEGLRRGFVKLFCRPATGVVVGGVVVAPSASELILPIALAVQNQLTVDHLALTFSVYPSLSGSITEAGRQLMRHDDLD